MDSMELYRAVKTLKGPASSISTEFRMECSHFLEAIFVQQVLKMIYILTYVLT